MSCRAWPLAILVLCCGALRALPPEGYERIVEAFGCQPADIESALADPGFFVLDSRTSSDLYRLTQSLERTGLTPLVTTDAMLYLWYSLHRKTLTTAEETKLLPATRDLLARLWSAYRRQPAGAPPEELMALVVGARLVGLTVDPPATVAAAADERLAKIMAATAVETYPGDDYTQYKPR